jgi:salicylate hydroxylase
MARAAAGGRDAKTAGPAAAALRNLLMPFFFGRLYERATGWLDDYDPGATRPGTEPAGRAPSRS